MSLLVINSTDYSENVIQKSYSVQRQDLYTEWVDGNWITHRVIARQQITGSFNMTFTSAAAYEAFKANIDTVKTVDGYCPVTLWVNNIKASETINAFVELTTKHRWTEAIYGGSPELAAVTVKITER